MKHTKGNWSESEKATGSIISNHIADVRDPNHAKYYGGYCIAESIANPHDRKLIVAAPEMLNYLIDLCDRFCIEENLKTYGKDRVLFGEYGRLIEIIEKATGLKIEEVLK